MSDIRGIATFISDGDWIESQDQSDYGIRLIQTGNIGNGEYLDKPDKAKYISEEIYYKLHCTDVHAGDILISRLPDPIGRSCIVPKTIGRAVTAVDCTILRINTNIYNPQLFVYYTQTDIYKSKLSHFLTGTTRKRISRKNLEKIVVPQYSRESQDDVVKKLDKITNLISMRKQQVEILDELVKSRFLEMFGDIQHNPCKWDIEPLSAVCHKITDGEHGSVQRVSEGYVYLNAKNIRQDGNIDWENITHISFKDHAKIFKRCNPEPDDILLTTTGTVGNIAIVPKVGPFSIDRGITLLKINNDRLNNIYLANLLNSEYLQQCMKNNIHASAIGHLFLKQVKSLSVMLPPLHLQNQFADYVVHIDKSKYCGTISLHLLEDVSHML